MGLETAQPLTSSLVREGVLTEKQLTALWTTGPANVFKLPVNTFAQGDVADFILYDPDAEWVLDENTAKSKGRNTPLWGKTIKGRVMGTWVEGVKVK